MRSRNIKHIEEVPWGVYIFVTPQGILADEEHRPLSIAAMKGDQRRIKQLIDAAKSYGFPDGKPYFMSGHRKITDEEWEEQRFRHVMGLLPDEYDVGALSEELRAKKRGFS